MNLEDITEPDLSRRQQIYLFGAVAGFPVQVALHLRRAYEESPWILVNTTALIINVMFFSALMAVFLGPAGGMLGLFLGNLVSVKAGEADWHDAFERLEEDHD